MIVAIADDITGAAEIAAIGWRRGLSAQVRTTFDPDTDADLVVVDTDTRSVAGCAAAITAENLAHSLGRASVQWCFKKVDSVLRGNVGVELEALMRALGKTRTILAPANPSRGRVIADGRYFIDHVPLDETEFRNDPEHPARSSLVADLLDLSEGCPVHVLAATAYRRRERGVVIAQSAAVGDLSEWAERLDELTLPAGGADFFRAILDKRQPARGLVPREPPTRMPGPRLFVCGSWSETSRRAVVEASRLGIRVCLMPGALFESPPPGDENLLGQWTDDIVAALATSECAVAAVGQPGRHGAPSARDVRTQMAALVQRVAGRMHVRQLLIEGGATAGAILRRIGWDTLDVLGEYGPGAVHLAVKGTSGQIVTLKPGSYPWPEGIWTRT
jgi:uncharacterized protein YgbK (DUF1537 family)